MTDESDYDAFRDGRAAVVLRRDVVRVTGPDAVVYLQGQVSQDLDRLAVGASGWTLVLQPQGKVDGFARITRAGADEVWLDTDPGWGESLLDRLVRFKLRTKADLDVVTWPCVRGLGPGSTADAVAFDWDPLHGGDRLGPGSGVDPGTPEVPAEVWEVVRIEAGFPLLGAELTGRTIPAEAALVVQRAVSLTKGCYTGQELVARIDARGGHVPKQLRWLAVDGPPPEPGASVEVDGRQVGTVTSAAAHPRGGAVALALVGRDVEPPVTARAGGAVARIEGRPLLS